jgi:hypothetical protein
MLHLESSRRAWSTAPGEREKNEGRTAGQP